MFNLSGRIAFLAVMCGTLAVAGCSGSDDDDTTSGDDDASEATVDSTFTSINTNIFQPTCAVSGCHGNGAASGGLDMEGDNAYTNTVSVNSSEASATMRIKPGDTANSYLILKLEGKGATVGGSSSMMPLGMAPLSEAQIQAIKDWVDNGAPQD